MGLLRPSPPLPTQSTPPHPVYSSPPCLPLPTQSIPPHSIHPLQQTHTNKIATNQYTSEIFQPNQNTWEKKNNKTNYNITRKNRYLNYWKQWRWFIATKHSNNTTKNTKFENSGKEQLIIKTIKKEGLNLPLSSCFLIVLLKRRSSIMKQMERVSICQGQ